MLSGSTNPILRAVVYIRRGNALWSDHRYFRVVGDHGDSVLLDVKQFADDPCPNVGQFHSVFLLWVSLEQLSGRVLYRHGCHEG